MKESFYFQRNYSGLNAAGRVELLEGGFFTRRLASPENDIENTRIDLGQFRLECGHHRTPVVSRGKLPPNFVSLGLMTKGNCSARCNGMPVGERNLRIYPESTEIFYHTSEEAEWFIFSVPRHLLQTELSTLPERITLPVNHIMTVPLSEAAHAQLKNLIENVFSFVRSLPDPRSLSDIADKLLNRLLCGYVTAIGSSNEQWRDIFPHRLLQLHGQLIMASEGLVLSSENNNLKLTELARSTGYTLRALEIIFNNTVGMPPKSWFMNLRLNGALYDLIYAQKDENVAKTATRWGFQHLARFSSIYRQTFGERPSETLARSREKKQIKL
ncbi:transcriptional regulator EutR [Leminorella richardii]|uniref:Transcriptional regulator EutR n=2 Tax=Leminorella richardii TaxID=158841 RepID=A0A2X4UQP5_9GAMM|nr:transcriptional regulator EutR [Leminorella richardii]